MYKREAEVVNIDLVNNPETYNLKIGGQTFIWENLDLTRNEYSKKTTNRNLEAWSNPEYREKMINVAKQNSKSQWENSEERHQNQSILMKRMSKEFWKDEEYRLKHIQIASDRLKERWKDPNFRERMKEKTHKQFFGKKIIHHDELRKIKYVSVEELPLYLESGWKLGRKFNI